MNIFTEPCQPAAVATLRSGIRIRRMFTGLVLAAFCLGSGLFAQTAGSYDLNRLVFAASSYIYRGQGEAQNAAVGKIDKGSTIVIDRSGSELHVRTLAPSGKNTEASIDIDALGRITSMAGDWGLTTIVYDPDKTTIQLRGPGGKHSLTFRPDQVVYDLGLIMFLLGAFSAEKQDKPMELKLIVSSDHGLDSYDGYVALVRKESIPIMGAQYSSLVFRIGLSGIIGAFAPTVMVWIDADSRQTLRVKLPTGMMELSEIRNRY